MRRRRSFSRYRPRRFVGRRRGRVGRFRRRRTSSVRPIRIGFRRA